MKISNVKNTSFTGLIAMRGTEDELYKVECYIALENPMTHSSNGTLLNINPNKEVFSNWREVEHIGVFF